MFAGAGPRLTLASLILSVCAHQTHSASNNRQLNQAQARDVKEDLGRPAGGGEQSLAALASYLLPNGTYSKLLARNQRHPDNTEAALLRLLDTIGPDMKPANGFMDPPNVTLVQAQRAWTLMHDHASEVAASRVALVWPQVERTLVGAEVSERCLKAAGRVAEGARDLKNWAIKLLNSWGNFPPVGLFEGTLGDIGSYHGCLSVPENEAIGHAHYCSLSFRPILPTRKDYELIINREPRELLELFPADDAFAELAGKSQYNHYVYIKVGTCFPIDCTPLDAQKIARLLARQALLTIGPVKCHSKSERDYSLEQVGHPLAMSSQDLNEGVYIWRPHISGAQMVALTCIGLLLAIVLLFTLADLMLNWTPKMLAITTWQASDETLGEVELNLGPLTVMNHVIGAPGPHEQQEPLELDNNNNNNNNDKDETREKAVNGTSRGQEARDTLQDARSPARKDKADRRRAGPPRSLLAQLVSDCSLIVNTREFFIISKEQMRSDILCMNGLRCITMSWIILAHTIQYNDWAAFGRIYEVETHLKSLLDQPIFNASYLVDTFFLMSGLLTSYSVFKSKTGRGSDFASLLADFSARSYLVGRYLRLTPQILLVSLLFILLPLGSSSGGPHWYSMTGEYSENCANHWWVNLLHLQAFYKPQEMCNFVCWWISVDMFYHLVALALILIILRLGPRLVPRLCGAVLLVNAIVQAARHYQLELPPNMLSTIPQTGAMWAQMTLGYFWTPTAHLFPFVFGLQLGYLMARRRTQIGGWFTWRRALGGWLLAGLLFLSVSFGTHFWVVGKWRYSNESSTAFALMAQVAWSMSIAWTIFACQLGHGGFINRLLSCRLFIVLGRASYLVYLSHFLVLFTFFGSQNLLLEPTQIMIIYLILGNVCISMIFGSFLCVAFEMPWLKIQRRIMRVVNG